MSSEQRYDYSHEQFDHEEIGDLDLFGDSTMNPLASISFDYVQENHVNNPQLGGQTFWDGLEISEQHQQLAMMGTLFDFDAFATSQPPAAFPPTVLSTTSEEDVAGDQYNRDGILRTFDNIAGHFPMNGLQAAQPFLEDFYNPRPTNSDVDVVGSASLEVPQTDPIKLSLTTHGVPAPEVDQTMEIDWSGPRKCHWPDCASKANFHSRASLKAHIKNIHVTPLVCTIPNCSHKKPFGKACDLKRHMATIHNIDRQYPCLEGGCQESFARKDKMMEHAKLKHQLFSCPYMHCSAIVFATQREPHVQESHGCYECAVGSCASSLRSFFTEQNLLRHLRTCHQITIYPAIDIVRKAAIGTKIYEAKCARSPLRPTYRDCASCLRRDKRQQSGPHSNSSCNVFH